MIRLRDVVLRSRLKIMANSTSVLAGSTKLAGRNTLTGNSASLQ